MDNETSTRFERIEADIVKLFSCTDESNRWQGKYGEKIETIEKGIDSMATSIKELLDKPQRRWDIVVAAAITAVVSAGVTGFISFYMVQGAL